MNLLRNDSLCKLFRPDIEKPTHEEPELAMRTMPRCQHVV
jgi:hypothetical protein